MTTRRLRYSERLELSESGSLAPLAFDEIPDRMVIAFLHLIEQAGKTPRVGERFLGSLRASLIGHFGLLADFDLDEFIPRAGTHAFLDGVEIAADETMQSHEYVERIKSGVGYIERSKRGSAMSDFPDRFNNLADRHRLGYRLEAGQIQRIGSPALSEVIVGPALLASQSTGWDQVERSYKEALRHQRGPRDENDDALTAAAAALEAALKAAGLQGKTLGQLSKDFKHSPLAAAQLRDTPELLTKLLERSGAIRNVDGDAHGRAPGEQPNVPQELVDLAVHLVGAFIVYLERSSRCR